MDNEFQSIIKKSVEKKALMFDNDRSRYALRSLYAGIYLILITIGSTYIGTYMQSIHPDLGKFSYSVFFPIGLVIIIFLNAELATSNMMYMTAGTHQKFITLKKAVGIVLFCTLFNLVGAVLTAWVMSQATNLSVMDEGSFLIKTIDGKLAKPLFKVFIEAILANIFVNIAILGQLRIKEESAKIMFIWSSIFMFVYLGYEHVIANFGLFSISYFLDHPLTLTQVLSHWLVAFLGNVVGGGLVMGLGYSYLNSSNNHLTLDK